MNDIDVLPPSLRQKSLSEREIVLLYDDALYSIDCLVALNWALLGWEGWVKYSDGSHGHADGIQGTTSIEQDSEEDWNGYVRRAASICRTTITQAQMSWNERKRTLPLYFCLTAKEESNT